MFHFAGGISFGVNVGNFLQLQSAFQRDRIVNAAAEIEKIRVAEKLPRQIFVKSGLFGLQHRFDLVRDAREFLHERLRRFSRASFPRTWPRYAASSSSAVSCDVKAFVEATPISGPACVRIVPAASRVIIEPMTLQIASVGEPLIFASRCAARVSAVSPDWLMQTVSVFESRIGSR